MDLVAALRSTGAVRAFTAEAIPDAVVARILDHARFAPSGGNRQAWRVVLVKDPTIRRGIRDAYLPGWYDYLAQATAGLVPFSPLTDEAREADAMTQAPAIAAAAAAGPGTFAEHLDEVPVLVVVLADLRAIAAVDKDATRYSFAGGASVYPFVWNILLAAREEGLGGVITTMAIRREEEVKALLHAPDELAVAAVVALGRPIHQPSRLKRQTVEEFAAVDAVDGPVLRTE